MILHQSVTHPQKNQRVLLSLSLSLSLKQITRHLASGNINYLSRHGDVGRKKTMRHRCHPPNQLSQSTVIEFTGYWSTNSSRGTRPGTAHVGPLRNTLNMDAGRCDREIGKSEAKHIRYLLQISKPLEPSGKQWWQLVFIGTVWHLYYDDLWSGVRRRQSHFYTTKETLLDFVSRK